MSSGEALGDRTKRYDREAGTATEATPGRACDWMVKEKGSGWFTSSRFDSTYVLGEGESIRSLAIKSIAPPPVQEIVSTNQISFHRLIVH